MGEIRRRRGRARRSENSVHAKSEERDVNGHSASKDGQSLSERWRLGDHRGAKSETMNMRRDARQVLIATRTIKTR